MTIAPFAFAVIFIAMVGFSTAPAQAQPTRVFVAAQGNDANPCSFAQPCRSFQHAHDTVAAGGEIDVLDPAGYGTLTIGKAISIQGHGFAGIAVPGGDGIAVNAGGSDNVSLRGLLIDGVGSGTNGIIINSAASVDVQDCLIRNFADTGVLLTATTATALFLSNTRIAANSQNGIVLNAVNSFSGLFDHIVVEKNGNHGLALFCSSKPLDFTVSGSVIANNATQGVFMNCSGPAAAALLLRGMVISHNGAGVFADGAQSLVRITRSTVNDNDTGFAVAAGGQIVSFEDNSLIGNTTDGAPTSTATFK